MLFRSARGRASPTDRTRESRLVFGAIGAHRAGVAGGSRGRAVTRRVVAIARKGRLAYATRLKTGVANLSGSRGEFDWSGAFGTTFWVDPKEKLSVVFMSQQGGLQRVLMRQLIRMLVMAAVAD